MNKKVIIGILIVLIIGLSVYIVYDKVYGIELFSENVNYKKDGFEKVEKKDTDSKNTTKDNETVNNDGDDKKNDNGVKEAQSYFVITYRDEEYKKWNVTNKRNLPIISSSKYQVSADKIVADLTAKSDEEWTSLNSQAEDREDIPFPTGVDYMLSVSYENASVISFKFTRSGAMGGVPWDKSLGYNYDKATGNVLAFGDILEGGKKEAFYIKVINEVSERANSKSDGGCLYDRWEDIVKDNMYKDGYWYFTDKGISFAFNRYELGCGAFGTPVISIGYNEINGYLKSKYRK